MRILLDENLPRKLKTDFDSGFEVKTVRDMGWLGKKNGELLTLIEKNEFNFFITIDKNIRNQQNLEKYKFNTFILNAPNNRRESLQRLIEIISVQIKQQEYKKLNVIS